MKGVLKNFLSNYPIDNIKASKKYSNLDGAAIKIMSNLDNSLYGLMNHFGGASFENGIYRIHDFGTSLAWTRIAHTFFPDFKETYCYGFDWFGRNYAIGTALYNKNITYMFDPSTAEALELEQSVVGFHVEDLVDYKDDTLAYDDFKIWMKENPPLSFEQCVGFKKPLFLGGEDTADNYELNDMEVYWELSYQIHNKTRELPKDTLINNISIGDGIEQS